MSSLSQALIIQIVICIVLFGFLFYFMIKNAQLKKEIHSKIKNSSKENSLK
ncbi:MAG: hypothetical protein AAF462_00275 [Thermodesulfobacteriota bacterium]